MKRQDIIDRRAEARRVCGRAAFPRILAGTIFILAGGEYMRLKPLLVLSGRYGATRSRALSKLNGRFTFLAAAGRALPLILIALLTLTAVAPAQTEKYPQT